MEVGHATRFPISMETGHFLPSSSVCNQKENKSVAVSSINSIALNLTIKCAN